MNYNYNEPARHKLLDVIGDLALIGMPIKGHIITKQDIVKPHLLDSKSYERTRKIINFDLTKKPIYDIVAIEKILPHRYPFTHWQDYGNENGIIGVKNVTMNENYSWDISQIILLWVFFNWSIIKPGNIFIKQVEEPHLYSTYFMKIDNVKFKRKVIPGDTVVFDLNLISPIRRGLVHMGGKGYVNGVVCIEAEMLAQVVKDREI